MILPNSNNTLNILIQMVPFAGQLEEKESASLQKIFSMVIDFIGTDDDRKVLKEKSQASLKESWLSFFSVYWRTPKEKCQVMNVYRWSGIQNKKRKEVVM
ncbi:hypothetical protein MACH09_47090 [Vibrio sp. MACH09]|uniref:hypothetical protein n=1 Tax=Vibrio sp. MACH09 TaxID=3025122 RepID=UPI00279457DF|nr:hypothetical protein [Vibrio sp. MACH09]GLO64201.1 hypothetical protein MACH09_47090 [Vibrio sp. MACH09]